MPLYFLDPTREPRECPGRPFFGGPRTVYQHCAKIVCDTKGCGFEHVADPPEGVSYEQHLRRDGKRCRKPSLRRSECFCNDTGRLGEEGAEPDVLVYCEAYGVWRAVLLRFGGRILCSHCGSDYKPTGRSYVPQVRKHLIPTWHPDFPANKGICPGSHERAAYTTDPHPTKAAALAAARLAWYEEHGSPHAPLAAAQDIPRGELVMDANTLRKICDYLNADLRLHGVHTYTVDPGKLEAALSAARAQTAEQQ